jgi:cysteine desulfurase/selenocysteine lyase
LKTIYNTIPHKFEAETPIAAAIVLALPLIVDNWHESIAAYELSLLNYATECLNNIPGVKIIGTAAEKRLFYRSHRRYSSP